MIPTWSFVFSEHKALRIAHVQGENFSLRSLTLQLTGVSAGSHVMWVIFANIDMLVAGHKIYIYFLFLIHK
jgi:hypothetical protein